MAAHLEGTTVKTLDFTGLAQKNGAVVAHVQIADDGRRSTWCAFRSAAPT